MEIEKLALEKEYLDLKAKLAGKNFYQLNVMSTEHWRLKTVERELAIKTNEILLAQNELKTSDTGKIVTRNHVLRVAAKWLNKPVNELEANFAEGLKNFDSLHKVIFGQDHVLAAIRDSLYLRATHLNDGII